MFPIAVISVTSFVNSASVNQPLKVPVPSVASVNVIGKSVISNVVGFVVDAPAPELYVAVYSIAVHLAYKVKLSSVTMVVAKLNAEVRPASEYQPANI